MTLRQQVLPARRLFHAVLVAHADVHVQHDVHVAHQSSGQTCTHYNLSGSLEKYREVHRPFFL